ncbi:IAA acetyltransferase [Rubellimicrobium mesophilum DSM 19309]|uniref:IAA acetyltransferase n=1 Tax=Rubellimicrobium mesophilum DSM 19309 TaxID=442562 RepID=A0A017HJL6_9RHOB|nr:GNAT family N-acetyltransferase [Rubellimicrobium mesophilum]EYD73974.1 IAA acetyltransferase [Rubellimicrobium mesophilum DSM 19309]
MTPTVREITVRLGDPCSEEARRLLGQSHALLASLYPPEHNHYLSVDELAQPHIDFWIAEADVQPLGCVALARLDGYGEVKSMFVDPAARGRGVGAALMAALEQRAHATGLPLLRLETGDDLHAAHRLYHRHGFSDCGPFGDYEEGPHSVFMEKRL